MLCGVAVCQSWAGVVAAGLLLVVIQAPTMGALGRGPTLASIVSVVVVLAICLAAVAWDWADDDDDDDDGGGAFDDGDGVAAGVADDDAPSPPTSFAARPPRSSASPRRLGGGGGGWPSPSEVLHVAAALSGIVFAIGSQKLLLNIRAEVSTDGASRWRVLASTA